jgi:hypothetical protein
MKGIKYRARFLTRPELDSDDFTDYVGGVVTGREYVIASDEGRLDCSWLKVRDFCHERRGTAEPAAG